MSIDLTDVGVGAAPNDGNGDPARTAFETVNANNTKIMLSLKLNNFVATTNPGTGDDDVDGYSAGSWWFNATLGLLWFCEDASTGAAVWTINDGKRARIRVASGTTDTLLASDTGKVVIYTNAASVAVTLPDTFAVDYHATIVQAGAGVPTVSVSGSDTVNGAGVGVAPSAQWKGMYLAQYAANTWLALL